MECLGIAIKESLLRLMGEKEFGENVTLRKINECEMGSSYTLRITSGERTLSVFIKCFEDGVGNSNTPIYFTNELVFYGDILKSFIKLGDVDCVAKCLDAGSGFIILDNLEFRGFKALDVNTGLSMKCARLVLEQLGKFHAFSFAMKDQKNAEFMKATSKLQETMFYPNTKEGYTQVFIYSIHDAFKLAKQSLPKNSIYVERLSNFILNIYEDLTELVCYSDDTYNVITHGDLWSNNIMYKLDEASASSGFPVFVDFQGCRYASPVHDLLFILLLGLDKHDREEFRDDLLRCYHRSLCSKLEELGSDPLRVFPYSALEDELIKHGRYALAMGLAGLPIFMDQAKHHNQSTDDDLQTYIRNVRARKTMKCKNKMLEIIMDAVDYGYL